MWFKNLLLFRLDPSFSRSPEQIAEALGEQAFKPCGGLEPFSYGWSAPLGRHGTELAHAANGFTLICARREQRLLPSSVVKDAMEERIAAIEEAEARPVRAKEKRRMRDEITFELMPRAFTRSVDTFAYFAPAQGWLVVDAATPKRAEDLVVLLGHSLPHDPVDPYEPVLSPTQLMTRWLEGRDKLPAGFELADECELRDPADEGALVRCLRQDLMAEEVRAHLKAHKFVQRLALTFEARLSFVLGAEMSLRRLRFLAVEELDADDQDDEIARFDANFAFMTTELKQLLERLQQVFGEGDA